MKRAMKELARGQGPDGRIKPWGPRRSSVDNILTCYSYHATKPLGSIPTIRELSAVYGGNARRRGRLTPVIVPILKFLEPDKIIGQHCLDHAAHRRSSFEDFRIESITSLRMPLSHRP